MAFGMVEAFPLHADALTPGKAVIAVAGRAGDQLEPGVATQCPEKHGQAAGDALEVDAVFRKAGIARCIADQPMPEPADLFLILEKFKHPTSRRSP